jgi:flagellar hook-associated protein 2
MSSTSSTSAIFTGASQFSSSLAQEIQRAVQFASLPMQQMQNNLTALESQQSTEQTLSSDFGNLQSAVSAAESAISGANAFSASSSNSSVASTSLTGTPMTGSYAVTVTKTGAYATATSSDGLAKVSDPDLASISDASRYVLSVGNSTYTIVPSGNTLTDLADALNMSGQVQATLVNIGSSTSPDYRLSLEGTQLGDLPIQLTAQNGSQPGQSLVTAESPPGAPAEYQVNGQPATPIQSNSATVTISPGVSVTLAGTGTTTVTVSQSTSALSDALSNLASAYNTAMSDLNKNRGQNGGALAGDSLVSTLSNTLRSIAGYSEGNGQISSLTSLGFSFDSNGVLSFDATAFASAINGQTAQLDAFLGSSTGGGFLQTATDALNGVMDPTSGLLTEDLSALSDEIDTTNQKISDDQNQVNTLQTNLTQQMSAADAAIATLEQQQQYMQSYFQAMQTTALSNAGL